MNPSLSVIICTHNPNRIYLQRVLDALKLQTLPTDQWEFLLVDNGSQDQLAEKWDLRWHPQARHIRENELGLTPARWRGIKESIGNLLVFVDDDNVLAADYLEQALGIGHRMEFIGVWGAHIEPEFDKNPPPWTRQYWGYLAVRSVEHSFWSKRTDDYSLLPFGAGLCIRRVVAEAYTQTLETDIAARKLGRKGDSLVSGEDTDMVLTACDLSYSYGLFAELRLLHLIPERRLTEDYLLRLIEGCTLSATLLQIRRNSGAPRRKSKPWWRLKLGAARRRLMMKRMDRLVLEARMRGQEAATAIFRRENLPVRETISKQSEMPVVPVD
jgi:glycosyltransferase involved in cell wall biosynthesis